jgi:hypothetical protein
MALAYTLEPQPIGAHADLESALGTTHAIVIVRRHPSGIGPGTPVAGLPLLTRLLHALADAGVTHATVFGPLDPEESQVVIDESVDSRLRIHLARVRPGETELLAMRRLVGAAGAPVLLVPGDLDCEPEALRPLLESASGTTGVARTEDRQPGLATVAVKAVAGLGDSYEFIDELASLAERGHARWVDVPARWSRLWEPQDIPGVERRIRDQVVADTPLDGPFATPLRAFFRAALPTLFRLHARPEHMASLGATLVVAGAALLAWPARWAAVAGALVTLVATVVMRLEEPLDLALRVRPQPWALDPAVRQAALSAAVLFAATLHLFLTSAPTWSILLGGAGAWCGALAAGVMHVTSRLRGEEERTEPPKWTATPPGGALWRARWLVAAPVPGIALTALAALDLLAGLAIAGSIGLGLLLLLAYYEHSLVVGPEPPGVPRA